MDELRLILLALGALLIAAIYLWDVLRRRRLEREEAEEHGAIGVIEAMEGSGSFLDALDAGRRRDDHDGDEAQATPAVEELDAVSGIVAERDTGDLADEDLDALARAVADEGGEPQPAADDPAADDPAADDPAARAGPESKPRTAAGGGNGAARRTPAESDLILVLTVMARKGERFSGPGLRAALESAGLEHGDMDIFHYHGDGELRTVTPAFSCANALEPGTFDPARLDEFTTTGVTLFLRLPSELDGLVVFEMMLGAARRIAEALDGVLCDDSRNPLTAQAITHDRERIAEFGRRQRLRAH